MSDVDCISNNVSLLIQHIILCALLPTPGTHHSVHNCDHKPAGKSLLLDPLDKLVHVSRVGIHALDDNRCMEDTCVSLLLRS